MKLQKKWKKIVVFFIAFSMCFGEIGAVPQVFAEETEEDAEETEEDVSEEASEDSDTAKTAISKTEVTIPIYEPVPEQLSVVNPKDGASYYFVSENKKIASVGKTTGILTGKKAGTVQVFLMKKGKKKNKLVGTCKVTVKKAKITKKNKKVKASVNGIITPVVSYKNSKAKYTYKSSDKKIVLVGEKIDEATGATSTVISAVAKGTAVLTVKEKYKKKKSVVGKITVTVKEVSVATESISMIKGQSLKIASVVTIKNQDTSKEVSYDYESADESVLEIDGTKMTAKKVTTGVNLDVYQTVDGERTKLGTVTVIIAEEDDKTPEAASDSNYIDLSDYNNDYEEGFDEYDDNDFYSVGSDYVGDESENMDDSYDDYENYLDDPEHSW